MNTKNWFPTLLGAGIIASGLALTSCEDEFTEADAIAAQDSTLIALKRLENENAIAENELDAQQELAFQMYQDSLERIGPVVSYSVTVVAGGSSNTSARTEGENFAEGATITLVQGGVSREATTNAGGVALFGDLRIGEAVVTVEAENHTTVTYTTSLGDPFSDLPEDNVNTVIPVLPLTVEAGATEVSGIAYVELDLTNDAPEFAEGAMVQATIDVNQIRNKYATCFSCDGKGEIQSATYTGLRQTATVGADGRYSLIIPNGNGSDGLGIQANIEFLPYEAEQTYVVEQGDSLAVVTKTVIFESTGTSNDDGHLDYDLPSVWVEVSAPVNNAQGFELEARAIRRAIDYGSTYNLDNRGADYADLDEFAFEADADGEIAGFIVDDVDDDTGEILTWSFTNDLDGNLIGAEYDTEPALTDNSATGSGASFMVNFATDYNIYVKGEGSGYWDVPQVNVVREYYDNGILVKEVADETADVADDITVTNGKLKSDNNDNLVGYITTSASVPTFTIVAPEVRKAYIDPEQINIDAAGKITSIGLGGDSDEGEGYTSQPMLTFKTVGENMGSGVSAFAIINSGEISSIEIANPGSSYMEDVNDWTYNITAPAGQSSNRTFKPASSNPNWDFDFGTGVVKK